jgi:hypothetical protein
MLAFSYLSVSSAQAQLDTAYAMKLAEHGSASLLLHKAKTQKTIGAVMAVGGPLIFFTGAGIYLKDFGVGIITDPQTENGDDARMRTGSALMVAGGLILAASIPLLLSAKKNEKRAKLTLSNPELLHFPEANRRIPGVTVVVNL